MNSDGQLGNDILGRGIAFPLRLGGGQIGMNAYESQVEQSIQLILRTGRGERVMRPDFGAGMEALAFEPINATTTTLTQHLVLENLTKFEPRIEVLKVTVDPTGAGIAGTLLIHIQYRVLLTDTVHNLVYPFYIERGEA